MYFYKYKLAEPKFDRDAIKIAKAVKDGLAELISKKGKVHCFKYIDSKNERVEYILIDKSIKDEADSICDPSVMGFISLSSLKKWVAIETMILYVAPSFRRKGIASKLYDEVLKDGQIVISGNQHNPKSRALWLKMAKNPSYVVWATDVNDLSKTSDVWEDDGEIICNLKLYDDINMKPRRPKEDIRFIAINPKFIK